MSDQRVGRPEGFFPFLAVASLGQVTLGWPLLTLDNPGVRRPGDGRLRRDDRGRPARHPPGY